MVQRIYRHDLRCPHCGSNWLPKDGCSRVISWDEMWSYVGARRPGLRQGRWVWTAIVEEADGRRWVDFEVGDRSEATFVRLYDRLPEAEKHVSDG